jgi:hypothetical protein
MVPLAFWVKVTSPMSGPAGKWHSIFALRRFGSGVTLRKLQMPLFRNAATGTRLADEIVEGDRVEASAPVRFPHGKGGVK